jgi:glycosyltransferase involved in cell wall biosynthesis
MSAHGATLAVSICICTFNRERLLRETLSRLARLVVPEGASLEIVVIDNNSTDGTAKVIENGAGPIPIRTARELTPGIAAARNAAVRTAQGNLMLWVDDDVLVEPEWAVRYATAARSNPGVALFGGPVRPHFEGSPPGWVHQLLPEIGQAYALREFPPGCVDIDAEHLPYGANFGTRRVIHDQLGFDTALGRVGKDGGCLSEESTFFEAALSMGFRGLWMPENPVLHVIPSERQTTGYLRQYYRLAGATPGTVKGDVTKLFRRPRWLWREWMQNEAAYRLLRHTARPERWFPHLKRAATAEGALFARQWS